ncbi:GtrA family protein [Clostridium sp. OF09-36]|uniref:GtrA family protein n=1 Tax=Clostridium sp. OF09-36 TaxID=2292310 RepID=UPI000E4BB6D7|nr:GtrA family protein [Clostridium sp. OF09-36]RHV84735.1 GtrA family protein [Clostridium sp. OF09-36]
MEEKYGEIVRYLVVGVLTTVVSLGTYYGCVFTFLNPQSALQLQLANVISWIAAVTFAYVMSRIYVFQSKRKNVIQEILSFYSSRLLTLLIDMAIMFTMVTLCGMNDKLAKLVVQVVVTVANYIFSKMFVFREE